MEVDYLHGRERSRVNSEESGGVMVVAGLELVSARTYSPTEAEIVAFAKQWDPFPWHTDIDAARRSVYGGLTAPGVMIDAIFIKLVHSAVRWPSDAVVGMIGAESVRYIHPVRPGDELKLRGEVTSLKQSRSNPDRCVVKIAWEMLRADQQVIYARTNVILFKSSCCKFDEADVV